MQAFPHNYSVVAAAGTTGEIALASPGLEPLASAAPSEFGGPGDRWSPETLIVAAVADCFILTFRAVAGAARLPWLSLECDVTGTLDRVERRPQFTAFHIRARLEIPPGTAEDQAARLLEKAEEHCLISNSLKARPHLETSIEVLEATAAPAR